MIDDRIQKFLIDICLKINFKSISTKNVFFSLNSHGFVIFCIFTKLYPVPKAQMKLYLITIIIHFDETNTNRRSFCVPFREKLNTNGISVFNPTVIIKISRLF